MLLDIALAVKNYTLSVFSLIRGEHSFTHASRQLTKNNFTVKFTELNKGVHQRA